MNQHRTLLETPPLQTLEARWGASLALVLSERSAALPHDITERLRFGREQALGKAREARRVAPVASAATAVSVVGSSRAGVLTLGATAPWWQRALGVLPLLVLVSGLVLIQQWSVQEQVMAAADFDAVLLADDLPPAAYSDPGFGEYLRTASP